MPTRPSYMRTRKTKRVPYRKKRTPYRSTKRVGRVTVPILRSPVPAREFVRLKYVHDGTYSWSSAFNVQYLTYQSSLYDPETAVGGHQPLWRDQLATMYTNYRVYGIAWRISFMNPQGASTTPPYRIAIRMTKDSTTETSMNTIEERVGTVSWIVPAWTASVITRKGYLSVAKAYGKSKKEFRADESFEAAIGADPSKMAYLICYAAPVTGASPVTSTLYVRVHLTYYAELFGRQTVSSS